MKFSDFNLYERRGSMITLITKNDVLKRGILLGVMPDGVLLMEFETEEGLAGFWETECDEILDVY